MIKSGIGLSCSESQGDSISLFIVPLNAPPILPTMHPPMLLSIQPIVCFETVLLYVTSFYRISLTPCLNRTLFCHIYFSQLLAFFVYPIKIRGRLFLGGRFVMLVFSTQKASKSNSAIRVTLLYQYRTESFS